MASLITHWFGAADGRSGYLRTTGRRTKKVVDIPVPSTWYAKPTGHTRRRQEIRLTHWDVAKSSFATRGGTANASVSPETLLLNYMPSQSAPSAAPQHSPPAITAECVLQVSRHLAVIADCLARIATASETSCAHLRQMSKEGWATFKARANGAGTSAHSDAKSSVAAYVEACRSASTLREVITYLLDNGCSDKGPLVAACTAIQSQVPVLECLGNELELRVCRAYELMVSAK